MAPPPIITTGPGAPMAAAVEDSARRHGTDEPARCRRIPQQAAVAAMRAAAAAAAFLPVVRPQTNWQERANATAQPRTEAPAAVGPRAQQWPSGGLRRHARSRAPFATFETCEAPLTMPSSRLIAPGMPPGSPEKSNLYMSIDGIFPRAHAAPCTLHGCSASVNLRAGA